MLRTRLFKSFKLNHIIRRLITDEERKLYEFDTPLPPTEPKVVYPTKVVKINKKDDVIAKKPEDVKYSSKHYADVDAIEEYHIIGAEIFKNAIKETLGILNKDEKEINTALKNLEKYVTEQQENEEAYGPNVNPLKFQEPTKYQKNFLRRLYYDQADYHHKHMFVPSYKFKIEPFNARYIYKFPLINGSEKDHMMTIFRRNNYVQGFIPPFVINHEEVEQVFKGLEELKGSTGMNFNSEEFQKMINDNYKRPENSDDPNVKTYLSLVNKLVDIIPTINHKIIPILCLNMFYRLNFNEKRVWIVLEEQILNKFHHFTVTELCQIYYISTMFCPKYTSNNFRSIIFAEINKLVNEDKLTLEELYTVMFAFRNTKVKALYNTIGENLIKLKDQVSKSLSKASDLSKIFYSWANHKPKEFTAYTHYPHRELVEKFIETYDQDLNDSILKMNQDELGRLATSLYLLKSDNVDPYINRIERKFLKICKESPNDVDPFNLHVILRAFSKMKDNKMAGSDKFFDELEPIVLNMLDTFKLNMQQFSDILFAYSVRGSGSQKLYQAFNNKINQDIERANNYHILHNIVYHLLFTDNRDMGLWRSVILQFNSIDSRLPIYYYRPFKIAGFFLDHGLSEKEKEIVGVNNIWEFKDKFYDPEQLYDYVKYEKLYYEHREYDDMKAMINGRLLLFPLAHVVYENAFVVHYSWDNRKLGINLWLDRHLVPKTKNDEIRINKKCLLHSKMMKLKGWEVFDVTWKELFNMGSQQSRDKFIHDWYHATSIKQEEKGVFKRNIKFI